MLELFVLIMEAIVVAFIFLEGLVVATEGFDDEILLIGFHAVGGGDVMGLVVTGRGVLFAAVALHN